MHALHDLWLPILLSGVAVWVASALAWMAIGHHRKDRDPIPGGKEREFMDTIKRLNIPPGNYGFPDFCQHHDLPPKERKEAMKALYNTRPMGMLRVWGEVNMGVNMFLTFLFYLITSMVIAFLAAGALPHGASFATVFHLCSLAGILAYCFATFPGDLWYQLKHRAMLMCWIDGIIFGLITGLIFAWLWPR